MLKEAGNRIGASILRAELLSDVFCSKRYEERSVSCGGRRSNPCEIVNLELEAQHRGQLSDAQPFARLLIVF